MKRSYRAYQQGGSRYLEERAGTLAAQSPRIIAEDVIAIAKAHDRWRDAEAISLNAAENIISRKCRHLLDSDLATRVTEGFPGDKDFPADLQNRFVDELEARIILLLRRMFGARHVEWRPVSTSMANATIFFALTKPGDLVLAQPEAAGGNYSYNPDGPPRAAGLVVKPLPFLEESFEVDVPGAVCAIRRDRPKLVVVGGSNVLFPYPLAPLRAAADEVGALLVYDAAHVGLLVATGMFQHPLSEGAHLMTMSSHKIMSGPVGGYILTNEDSLADAILSYGFPTLLQTRDQNKYAAAAHALAEMTEFGEAYCRQCIANARRLARELEQRGFEIVAASREFTGTHQIFVLLPEAVPDDFENRCQRANLLVTRAQRMGTIPRPAIRLTSQEVTRRGFGEDDMALIAEWIGRILLDGAEPAAVAAEISRTLTRFPTLRFSFD